MGRLICCWTYSIFVIFLTFTCAQNYQSHLNYHPQQHNRGYYTQHTVFSNPLLNNPYQSPHNPPSGPGFYNPPSRQYNRPNFHHQHHFGGFFGDDRLPFDEPLFIPAGSLEIAESPGQVTNYNKALQEILDEQFGNSVGGNDSNSGFNSGGGDQLNFNSNVFGGGTSYVRVRQSFGNRKSNYDYQYAV